ncbi:hypothetical protein X777_01259 [Ooceraea biroi]|uniref:Uncharacterized protein n=1 Tax=Ooceraea biroi TaxID=2015173 RepID=A0A026WQH9_OOCBI|nr:hypothetical protein X777_01259 [Ooceraea biroi]
MLDLSRYVEIVLSLHAFSQVFPITYFVERRNNKMQLDAGGPSNVLPRYSRVSFHRRAPELCWQRRFHHEVPDRSLRRYRDNRGPLQVTIVQHDLRSGWAGRRTAQRDDVRRGELMMIRRLSGRDHSR